jgi:uncharacterized protein YndB with AHSA1/START domain
MTHGTYEAIDAAPTLRFERDLRHPVAKVWHAITDPAQLPHWFPGTVTLDLRVGGALQFAESDMTFEGEVTALEPQRRFAFTWGGDQLDFELEPTDDGAACVLRLTVVLSEAVKAARDAAGWHVCLDRLAQLLDGTPGAPLSSDATAEWRSHYEEYEQRGFPAGAPIPEKAHGGR